MKSSLPSWDLSALYSSTKDKKIKQDLQKATKQAEKFQKNYKGKIARLSGDNIAGAIKEYEKLADLLGRLSSYAYLIYAENTSNPNNTSFYQNISEQVSDILTNTLFFTLEINNIKESDLKKKFSSKKLCVYKPWIRDVRIFKKHQLSDDLEKLLHEKDVTSSSWVRLFDQTLADLRFPFNKKMVTCTEILDYLSSKKPLERKQAAKSLGKTLGENAKTFALITNILAKDKSIEDNWRNFKAPISSRNLNNLIEDEVVDSLIKTVKKNYPKLTHRYYKLKAKWMGKKQIDYWDRNAPLPNDKSKKIPWKKAVEIVLSSYESFSPKLAKIGKQFFDENWIDVPPRDGKDSGAFSHPTVPSAHPYILLNYQEKLRDVMTLAHELGHGVHQVLSSKQGALMADTPLTLAETASVFGEQITFRSILDQEKNPERRKNIIAAKVEDMLNTVVRQVAFCEFERIIHDERKKGEVPLEKINKTWMDIQSDSLGKSIKFSEEYQYYWSYIPHFIHSPFYVYSYAFGDCLVNSLYTKYMEGMDNFEEKYINMLKAGGTLRHKELLAPFGLDATKSSFWQKGLNMISGLIDELED